MKGACGTWGKPHPDFFVFHADFFSPDRNRRQNALSLYGIKTGNINYSISLTSAVADDPVCTLPYYN